MLVSSLRAEVEQKEQIAALAISGKQDLGNTNFETMFKNLEQEHSKSVQKSKSLEENNKKLESELRDARDNAELLEFRLLELEQRESRERSPDLVRKQEKGDTEERMSVGDSGCSGSLISLDEIVDTPTDFRHEKIGDTKTKLHQLMEHIPEPSGKSLLLQTLALFETLLAKITSMKNENGTLSGENVRLTACLQSKCSVEDDLRNTEDKLKSVNEELQETLQKVLTADRKFNELSLEMAKKETLHNQILDRQRSIESDLKKEVDAAHNKLNSARLGFKAESEMYQDSLERFSHQERCISELEAKCSDLERENSELVSTLRQLEKRRESISSGDFPHSHHVKDPSVLSDSSFEHSTTKTTGSSSGVSSDLSEHSDSDNDTSDPGQEFINKEQFIESGIFEELAMTSMEQGTQTTDTLQVISEADSDKMSELGDSSIILVGDPPALATSTPSSLCKISEYGSCEELEMINGPGRYDHREELKTLSTKLKEMETKWEILYTQHQEVVEERCELEEAENDSRLRAQKLEMQYGDSLDRLQLVKEELLLERQNNYDLKLQMEEFMNKDERNQDDLDSLQLHIQEQEQIIRDLEDKAIYYNEQLNLLNMGIKIAGWWRTWSWLLVNDEEIHRINNESNDSNDAAVINKQKFKDMLEDQYKNVSAIRTDFEQREQGLAQQIECLQQEYDQFLSSLVNLLCVGSNNNNEASDYKDEVIKKVQSLLNNELTLKKQVNDLEKKETAYTKTIQEADTIMARVEYSYQGRIKELEQEKHDLKEKIWSLETNLSKQKTLHDQKDEMKTISELIEKLTQIEKSEAQMKEKVKSLENYSEEMKMKLVEREIANAKIKHELQDQDELLKRISDMDLENKKMTEEISRLKDIEQKMSELRKTEELLRNRLLELEVSEQSLVSGEEDDKQNNNDTNQICTELKQKMSETPAQETGRQDQDRQDTGDTDRITVRTKSVVVETSTSQHVPADNEILRKQVSTLKLQIRDLETEVESKCAELESAELGYRSEVSTHQLVTSSASSQAGQTGSFHRYRSMRDHTGRFFLCVKIR